jgi:hypothetical protein
MKKVLEQAARLQAIVPDAVLVGGSAAFIYAGHRYSLDHDHVVADKWKDWNVITETCKNVVKAVMGNAGA